MGKSVMEIDIDRLYGRLMELGKIGQVGSTGVNRFAFTKEDKEAQKLVLKWMEEAGMNVRHDNFGNLIGRKEGNNPELPVVMMGSHIDTVPKGGLFDGTVGVIGAIEVVQVLKDAKFQHEHPIEVVAFSDEEGTRFSDGLFGSRGMVGLVAEKDLHLKDSNGISRYEALRNFGFNIDPDKIQKSIRKSGEIKLYLEMHIEQGPYLEENNKSVGIVKGIAGPVWINIRITGEAGHAGTTPMNMRKDPMLGASEIIKEIEKICKGDLSKTLVGTVGNIKASPGGRNVIPGSVEFTVDIRDIDKQKRTKAIDLIIGELRKICYERGIDGKVEILQEIEPVMCSKEIIETLEHESECLNLNAPVMISGAGHDAMFMEKITDIGMIFIRCKDGISHNPKEWASKEDILDGALLLLKTIQKYI